MLEVIEQLLIEDTKFKEVMVLCGGYEYLIEVNQIATGHDE